MFAEYNYDFFPIIKVKLNNVDNDNDFDNFLQSWLNLYIQQKDFTFIFDTTNVSDVPFKYSIRMAEFIRRLKKDNSYHYLQKSIIIVNSVFVKRMLNIIFKIQSPVAPVYILDDEKQEYINSILNNENIQGITCIMPGKSYIPFL
tara:strand:- start:37 stop:471 length:435 start_codon:yes stop_codon:yes gene_type:complete